MKYSLCVRSRRPSQPSPHLLCDTPIGSHTHRSWNCRRVGMSCPNWGSGTPPRILEEVPGSPAKGGNSFDFINFWEYWVTYVCKAFNLSKTPHLLYAQLCLQICIKSYKRGGSPSDKMWLYVADACLFRGSLVFYRFIKRVSSCGFCSSSAFHSASERLQKTQQQALSVTCTWKGFLGTPHWAWNAIWTYDLWSAGGHSKLKQVRFVLIVHDIAEPPN